MINLYPGLGLGGAQSRLLAFGLGSWFEVEIIIELKKDKKEAGFAKWVVRKIRVNIKVYYNNELIGEKEQIFHDFDNLITVLAILRKLKVFVRNIKINVKEVNNIKAHLLENVIKVKFLEKQ